MCRWVGVSGVQTSTNLPRGGIHSVGVTALESSSQSRRARSPVCTRLGGGSELVETSFDVKPLALLFQGMVLPLCIILQIVKLVDLLIKGVGKSCSKQIKCLDIVQIIPSMLSKTLKFGHIVVHIFPLHLEALL